MKNSPLRFFFGLFGLVAALAVTGCNSMSDKHDYDTTVVRFFMEADAGDAFASATLPVSGVQIAVNSNPVITEFDIVNVQEVKADLGQFLLFQLTPDAARDVYRMTGDHQGRRLVLTINGKPFGARMIDHPFNAGTIATFVEMDDKLLPALVKNINGTSKDIQEKLAKAKS